MNSKFSSVFYIPLLVVLVGLSFFSGVNIGVSQTPGSDVATNVINKDLHKNEDVDFEPFWQAWNLLEEHFVSSTTTDDISDEEKVYGAIQGLTKAYGDPYTTFLPPKENEIFETEIRGQFEGVGMEIGIKDETLTVISPLQGTPADRAGIMSGDKIINIDGKSTVGISVEEAVQLIRGERGTAVNLTIIRDGRSEAFDIEIIRDKISIPTIETEVLEDEGIFTIRLFNFSESSPTQFRQALREFVKSINAGETDKLIFDLRGNPGGFLEASIDISSWFLPKGAVVVTENFGGAREDIIHRSKGYNIFKNLEMVILIDGGSASASEIVAGALSQHGVAKLVGAQTFGKGSVQRLFNITEDTALKVTIARWLTPNGTSISEGGLTPDLEVEVTEEDVEAGIDAQFNEAVNILTE